MISEKQCRISAYSYVYMMAWEGCTSLETRETRETSKTAGGLKQVVKEIEMEAGVSVEEGGCFLVAAAKPPGSIPLPPPDDR